MHSVIIPQRLCFLLVLQLLTASQTWRLTKASSAELSSSSSVLKSSSSTGLAGLKEVLMSAEDNNQRNVADELNMEAELKRGIGNDGLQPPHPEDASTNPANRKDKVKYAAGVWLSRRKRSDATSSLYLNSPPPGHHNNSPWKRRPRILHESSSKSEKHHHVPESLWPLEATQLAASNEVEQPHTPIPVTAHLKAAGRDMAMQMMNKRRMGNGRMYDVPQIGE